jgi:amidophosphoribosyltransferase
LGGLFGAVSKGYLARDLFFGVDYHSHLGTEVGGIAFLDEDIEVLTQDISNSQFKSEFQKYFGDIKGRLGIGVIGDREEDEPVKFVSKIGTFALCTSGLIRNAVALSSDLVENGTTLKRSRGKGSATTLNQTEIVGELIGKGKDIVDGIRRMYAEIEGSVSLLLLSKDERNIYAAGDLFPLVLGKRGDDWAITSETSAFPNLGYDVYKFLDYREIVSVGESGVKTRADAPDERKFCPFLHVYFGFPTSDYYGVNGEVVRERCGSSLADNDDVTADLVLGIADSGFPHSIGYVKRKMELAKERAKTALERFRLGEIGADELEGTVAKALDSMPPLRRPLVKYTAGWGRSYIPPTQDKRELIAKYKQVPNPQLMRGLRIILIDDSIRRGTQLRDLLSEKIWPYQPKEIHGRIASPPQMFPCILDLATKNQDLATRKAIARLEGGDTLDIDDYMNPHSAKYAMMVDEVRKMIGFTTLKYQMLEGMIAAVVDAPNNLGLRREDLCLYCWTGKF